MKSKFRHVALIGKYQATSSGAAGASTRNSLDEIAHFLMDQGCDVVRTVTCAWW
jgi:NAD+ kinase